MPIHDFEELRVDEPALIGPSWTAKLVRALRGLRIDGFKGGRVDHRGPGVNLAVDGLVPTRPPLSPIFTPTANGVDLSFTNGVIFVPYFASTSEVTIPSLSARPYRPKVGGTEIDEDGAALSLGAGTHWICAQVTLQEVQDRVSSDAANYKDWTSSGPTPDTNSDSHTHDTLVELDHYNYGVNASGVAIVDAGSTFASTRDSYLLRNYPMGVIQVDQTGGEYSVDLTASEWFTYGSFRIPVSPYVVNAAYGYSPRVDNGSIVGSPPSDGPIP